MLAKFEKVLHDVNAEIWAGKYRNLEILPHWHIDHEIIHCETGKIFVMLNGLSMTLLPGDSVYCYSRDIHQISVEPGSINSMIVFSPLGLPPGFPNSRLQSPIIRNDTMFHHAFDVIYREINALSEYFEELSYAVLCEYLVLLMRSYPQTKSFDSNVRQRIAEQNKLIEVLTTASAHITFRDAAKMMGYSEPYFSRYFKSTFGVTFSQYMNAIKTADAILLLSYSPELTITQVAVNCGFNTIRHFNRVFKELTGVSPSAFARGNMGRTIPSIQLGEHFVPTLSSSIHIDYFEDPEVKRGV